MRYSKKLPFKSPNIVFIRLTFALFLITSFFGFLRIFNVYAESVTTAVTVGNSAPSFTAGPAENPVSSASSPTNVGSNVTGIKGETIDW